MGHGSKNKNPSTPQFGHVQYTLSNLRESRFWQPRFITHQWRCSEYRNNIFETFNSKYCDRKYRRPVTFGMTTRYGMNCSLAVGNMECCMIQWNLFSAEMVASEWWFCDKCINRIFFYCVFT